MIRYIKNSKTYIRYSNWEYWPMWLVYLPVIPVWLYFALRSKRFFFFTNVNPLFSAADLMGSSKSQILNKIPSAYRPITILNKNISNRFAQAKKEILNHKLSYPIIAKPDVGERGILVELIKNEQELYDYLSANDIDIIIQEYIKYPNECGIFYIRKPSQDRGHVVSVGLKKQFVLTGNGRSTIRELMRDEPRYKLQIERLEAKEESLLEKVLAEKEIYIMDPIGNHNRGTTFVDGSHLINQKLHELFDKINVAIEDVYYGRFDIKYESWEDLLEGRNFKILELNGIASEPIHIYDTTIPIREKYKSFFSLWKAIFEISSLQKERGILPIKSRDGFQILKNYKSYINSLNQDWRQERPIGQIKIS